MQERFECAYDPECWRVRLQSATLYELLQYELSQMTEDEINDAFLQELSGDDMSDI